MRCVVGVALFLVLYFGGCKLLGQVTTARAGKVAGANAVTKYHALIGVGSGVVAILGCSLPTLFVRMSERSERRRYSEAERE